MVDGAGMDLAGTGRRDTLAEASVVVLLEPDVETFPPRWGLRGTRFAECFTACTLNTSFLEDFSS